MKATVFSKKSLCKAMCMTVVVIVTASTVIGCAMTQRVTSANAFSVMVGPSFGAFTHNLDHVDTITGATKIMPSAGVCTEIGISNHVLETGIDYVGFHQSLEYAADQGFEGERTFDYHQLRVPFTYNFQLFRDTGGRARVVLKTGLSAGYTISKTITDSGALPDYTFESWDIGPLLGFAAYPLSIENSRVGFYCDLYRGSQIYDDTYFKDSDAGHLTNAKFGVVWQF